jgi:hypothetical protein
MRRLQFNRHALSLGALSLLFGCGGSQPPIDALRSYSVPRPQGTWFPEAPTRPHLPGWLSPALRHHTGSGQTVIYVSEENDSEVVVYPEPQPTASPAGIITDGISDPWGLCIDQNDNLYSVNQSGTVTEYPPGSTLPSATYSQDLGRPLYCIIDRHGNLFVGNGNGGVNGGKVVEYRAGSTNAYQVLETPGTEVDDMDFDTQGNLYAAYRGGSGSYGTSVEKFAPGSVSGTILGMKLNQPQGLIVDDKDEIVVVTEKSPGNNYLDVFPRGKRSARLRFAQPNDSYPIQIAITKGERSLFATTFNNGGIYDTPYPLSRIAGWTLKQFDPYGLQQGIALSNGHVFGSPVSNGSISGGRTGMREMAKAVAP